jgi:hypothetical protein
MPVSDVGLAEVLQSAAAATGVGTAIVMAGFDKLTLQVSGTFVGTVTFEGTIDDTTWFVVGLKTAADGAAVTTATAAGAFKLPADGPCLSQVRANVTAYTSGAITVRSRKEYR